MDFRDRRRNIVSFVQKMLDEVKEKCIEKDVKNVGSMAHRVIVVCKACMHGSRSFFHVVADGLDYLAHLVLLGGLCA